MGVEFKPSGSNFKTVPDKIKNKLKTITINKNTKKISILKKNPIAPNNFSNKFIENLNRNMPNQLKIKLNNKNKSEKLKLKFTTKIPIPN